MTLEKSKIILGSLENDSQETIACTACVHCGGVIPLPPVRKLVDKIYSTEQARQMQQQGKTMRGFCTRCCGPVCGPACAACVPVEQLLENYEQGRPVDYVPVRISVPGETPKG